MRGYLLRTSRRLPVGTFFAAEFPASFAALALVLTGRECRLCRKRLVRHHTCCVSRIDWLGVFPSEHP